MPAESRIQWIIWGLTYPIPWLAWHREKPCSEIINGANLKMTPPLRNAEGYRVRVTLHKQTFSSAEHVAVAGAKWSYVSVPESIQW